ncbi:DUF1707 domain-containing protein [Planotetraspora sp. A-T 1434]|uniref:DUF1707 SHOCT-like domain-containing protein n=1 Tax=Planotetraspora sp. A-T 1434 TaxID=2979219 RepID=UPI0021C220C8|nr:DUF1707 domain-containing protein [Planotetraspora sp. A-T 1434]MCT9928620.1 DUF1707 domain-containing protein [Planotetraspora sp. A-T 1434]
MAATPEMRASDGDRDRVAAALREHVTEGRLSVDEFNERLEQVYQSRTYGELAKLTADLPEIDLHTLPATVSAPRGRPARPAAAQGALKASWAAWAVASGVNWVVWLIVGITSGHMVYPWPLWVMGPWGVILLLGTLFGGMHGSDRRR